jgi:hypothetical protein
MSYAQWRNSYTFFVYLGIILIPVLGFYSGLSGRVRTVYLFSLRAVSLLSSRFTASALVSFSNFLKYLVFHVFISLSTVFICRSSWILRLFMYERESAGGFRCWNQRLYSMAECHMSTWVWVLLCMGGVCFLLRLLIFFRVASAFVSLFGWAVYFWFWCALSMSVFYRDACPDISKRNDNSEIFIYHGICLSCISSQVLLYGL